MTLLLVLVGGAVGAPVRYLVDRAVQSRHDTVVPWGTLAVNVAGSAVLGALLGAAGAGRLPAWSLTLVGTGFCGGLTTFSSFGYETLRLVEEGSLVEAALNVGLSMVAGLVAAAGAWALVALALG